mmetsp:Transcript_5219/g.18806  ORF Transcript_5219/g.18806 Transcript_5219/m.18806 type:complete len:243 (-) Transcript_5219:176-904(-)
MTSNLSSLVSRNTSTMVRHVPLIATEAPTLARSRLPSGNWSVNVRNSSPSSIHETSALPSTIPVKTRLGKRRFPPSRGRKGEKTRPCRLGGKHEDCGALNRVNDPARAPPRTPQARPVPIFVILFLDSQKANSWGFLENQDTTFAFKGPAWTVAVRGWPRDRGLQRKRPPWRTWREEGRRNPRPHVASRLDRAWRSGSPSPRLASLWASSLDLPPSASTSSTWTMRRTTQTSSSRRRRPCRL